MATTQPSPRMPAALQPARTTLMIKPVGGLCNLDCHYCYYLPTIDEVYGGREHRMTIDTLESVFAGYLQHAGRHVTIAWQGGEPTLAGLAFFEKAVEFQAKYRRPDQTIDNALQTNGTLLDDDWCRFLRQHNFLVGISIDGLGADHDHYRVDKQGRPSYPRVIAGLKLLRKHQVEHNILCVLNNRNVKKPTAIFNALLQLGERWMQFIPAVEWMEENKAPQPPELAAFSPDPHDYGKFLCAIFDLWFDRHRDRISVRDFDTVLGRMVTGTTPLCIMAEGCHSQLTVEHNGDLYGCDHFVERRWQLGHIGREDMVSLTIGGSGSSTAGATAAGGREKLLAAQESTAGTRPWHPLQTDSQKSEVDRAWLGRADNDRLATFTARKQHLPEGCRACPWLDLCWGGCPKHRPHRGELPEPTILCESYRMFFSHAHLRLEWLAQHLRLGIQPPPPQAQAAASRSKKKRRKAR